jgi:hypothetical protein
LVPKRSSEYIGTAVRARAAAIERADATLYFFRMADSHFLRRTATDASQYCALLAAFRRSEGATEDASA